MIDLHATEDGDSFCPLLYLLECYEAKVLDNFLFRLPKSDLCSSRILNNCMIHHIIIHKRSTDRECRGLAHVFWYVDSR